MDPQWIDAFAETLFLTSSGPTTPYNPVEPADSLLRKHSEQISVDEHELRSFDTTPKLGGSGDGKESDREPETLCLNCQDIFAKMQQLTFKMATSEFGTLVGSLEHISEGTKCPLCDFLYSMRTHNSEAGVYHLHAFSSNNLFAPRRTTPALREKSWTPSDAPFFAVVSDETRRLRTAEARIRFKDTGFIAPVQPGAYEKWPLWRSGSSSPNPRYFSRYRHEDHDSFGRPVQEDKIDYSLLKEWMDVEHEDTPQRTSTPSKSRGLKLINCVDRTVQNALPKRPKYAALSYVWGEAGRLARPSQEVDRLPQECPLVVEDAITVTLQIGLQYLWVDAYCISHQGSIRHDQIASMDTFYSNATVCLVAAAGEDSEYGLPGVSHRRRRTQPAVQIGKVQLVSTLPDPLEFLQRSKYNTRAWTYQEWLSSTNKLVFTDHQVIFIAPGRMLLESVDASPQSKGLASEIHKQWMTDELLEAGSIHQRKQIKYLVDGTSCPGPVATSVKTRSLSLIEYHIEQYTARDLSRDSDALNAGKAILDRFQQEKQPLEHLWGIPFRRQDGFSDLVQRGSSEAVAVSFTYGLAWTHGTFSDSRLRQRRPEFPSWSWTGWTGSVHPLATNAVEYTDVGEHPSFQFRGKKEETTFTFPDAQGRYGAVTRWRSKFALDKAPKRLWTTAQVYKMKFFLWPGQAGHNSTVSDGDRMTAEAALFAKQDVGMPTETSPPEPGWYLTSKSPSWTRLHLTRTTLDDEEADQHVFRSSVDEKSLTGRLSFSSAWKQRLEESTWHAIILGYDRTADSVFLLVVGRIRGTDEFMERIGVMQISTSQLLSWHHEEQSFWLG